ncbi:MAG: RIP metalloprotease RseP [Legionella sp.]|nr:RIP metalloprotease RseP [Legionella sp.]
MLLTITYFIIALLLLVVIHEYGHFLVARLCGVKVLRFSFGFGKVLFRWHDKRGTEYAWSILPLGGYVKMLDEGEDSVPENERHLAFNNKPVLARIAIVVAGPLFNFLFAFIALWLVLIIGIYSLAPMIDAVKPDTPAATAGFKPKEEIVSLNDKPIASWRDFQFALMPLMGSNEDVAVGIKSMVTGHEETRILSLSKWQWDAKKPDPLGSLGLVPFIPAVAPIVGEILPDSPAAMAGIQVSDRIQMMDGKPVDDWLDLVEYVRKNPDKKLTLSILRKGQPLTISLITGSKENNHKKEGFLGLRSQKVDWPSKWLRFQRQSPLDALGTAFTQTVELTTTTFSLIGRFITGKLAIQNLSGPVGIAQGAGESGRSGIASYLAFLALVSISLGVLNLLPIPMLDGGHLLFYLIEFVCRRPLPDLAKSIGLYLGLAFLVGIMVLALSNDIARLTG